MRPGGLVGEPAGDGRQQVTAGLAGRDKQSWVNTGSPCNHNKISVVVALYPATTAGLWATLPKMAASTV